MVETILLWSVRLWAKNMASWSIWLSLVHNPSGPWFEPRTCRKQKCCLFSSVRTPDITQQQKPASSHPESGRASMGSCGRSKWLCVGLVACTSVQGMKTGHAQICGRGRRNVARLEKATQKPACNGCKRAILATKANCAPRLIGTGLPDDSNGTQLEGHGIRSLGRRTRQNNNVEDGQRGNWALREFSFFWPTRLPLCPANPLG